MNTIYVRRRLRVIVPDGHGATPVNVIATFQKNLEDLGYLLGPGVVDRLKLLPVERVESFYHRLVKDLRAIVGAHRSFVPFYPDFPRQVMSMSEGELYLNAIMHYWTLDRPDPVGEPRPALVDRPAMRVIGLGSREDFESIFTLLVRSKSPMSPQDREDVKWFVAQYRDDIRRLLPETIPSKENLAYVGAQLLREAPEAANELDQHVKTATDVLRLAVAMSDGDVSLATAGKFGRFSRRARITLLGWVERAGSRTEDMLRWRPRWIRLGERLHPGEYARRFPRTAEAFDVIRNKTPFVTFNRQIEAALSTCDITGTLNLLATRPGDLARRLDHLTRISADPAAVVARFSEQAGVVSTPVLLQVMTHFARRGEPGGLRVFFPKGEVGNLFATARPLPPAFSGIPDAVVQACERVLLERFAKLAPLGRCYLDPQLKNYLVPFSQRSASKALRTLVRGSRLPLPACTTLRFFVWWKNGSSRADIDLSAAMYGPDYQYIDTLAYYNLRNFGAHHSGDIVDAPVGAAEFIDIDIDRLRSVNVRYVVMSINSYTEQPYCELPECFAGWMARTHPNSGEVFEAKTVVDKVDIASDTRMCLPAIFDLQDRQVIWADIALRKHPIFANNVHNNLRGVSLMVRALTQLQKPDLHTLFNLHVRARGTLVPDIAAAQTVFGVERGVTPFDLDRIGAQFM